MILLSLLVSANIGFALEEYPAPFHKEYKQLKGHFLDSIYDSNEDEIRNFAANIFEPMKYFKSDNPSTSEAEFVLCKLIKGNDSQNTYILKCLLKDYIFLEHNFDFNKFAAQLAKGKTEVRQYRFLIRVEHWYISFSSESCRKNIF
ncbi:MAG: hypothetical protein K2W94_02245 [Alphaproteobacteria bacterium]|nr:hypothetical protein [Alphaproteobacteria bacterium]